MTTNDKLNRPNRLVDDQNLVDGLRKHAATLTGMTIGGAALKNDDIVAAVLGRIATANAVGPARVAFQAVVKADRDERAKTRAFVSAVRRGLRVIFEGQLEVLAEFGLRPPKAPTPLTPTQKAAAVAKAQATRKLRHTMGAKQRAKIKATDPAAATPPAAPPPVVPKPQA